MIVIKIIFCGNALRNMINRHNHFTLASEHFSRHETKYGVFEIRLLFHPHYFKRILHGTVYKGSNMLSPFSR